MAQKRTGVTVKIDPDIHRRLKTITSWLNKDLGQYISELLGPILEKELAKVAKEMEGGQKHTKG
jgi:hypothetical protein